VDRRSVAVVALGEKKAYETEDEPHPEGDPAGRGGDQIKQLHSDQAYA
jgi:hypothetical protein